MVAPYHSASRTPPFLRLPEELLQEIAFAISALQPLGPPFILLPLMLTCTLIHNMMDHNLWARVFHYKFDSGAIRRRALDPLPRQCTDQLMRYCTAMQVLRGANHYFGTAFEAEEFSFGLEDALLTALMMMYEDDGRNSRQLVEWARLPPLLSSIITRRLYEGSEGNHHWAIQNRLNACAIWLMWLTMSEGALQLNSFLTRGSWVAQRL